MQTPFPELYDEKEAARLLRVSVACMQRWRWSGDGPPFIRLGRRAVRYDASTLRDYILLQSRTSTSDTGDVHAAV
jgi:Helix-turn-helix domain